MAMGAATKLRRVVRNVQYVLAIELLCAAQGIEYRAPLIPGLGVRRAHAKVRELVDPLVEDRVPSTDIAALADGIANGHFDFSVAYDHASV
jgi:histidine ammonia-lyase